MNFKKTLLSSLLLSSLIVAGGAVNGQTIPVESTPSSDKWQYNLFNPVPRELMREMSTDRPDSTESPYTVDAGRYQIEASYFDYSRDRNHREKVTTWTYGSFNIKAGLLNNVDLQVIFDSYVNETVQGQGVRTSTSGFSDIQMRMKINLWGNDGGETALAIMPFVKIPTGTEMSNDRWEGGVIIPFAYQLSEGIEVGLMLETNFVYDGGSSSYETEWAHTAAIGFDVIGDLGAFAEYVGIAGSASGFKYPASFHTGLTYAMTEDLQLDAGVRIGLNRAAEDFGVFAGTSIRF